MLNTKTAALKSVPASPRAKVARKGKATRKEPGVVDSVRLACRKGNRLATAIGFALGGLVPLATFMVAHFELSPTFWADPLFAIVLGGLAYSAPTVYQWGVRAFQSRYKAVGFVALVEGCMVLSGQPWLAHTALAYLVLINGTATGVTLALGQRGQ